MSDITGPSSTLPGSLHATAAGAMCDDHPDRPAVGRVQGETDSFGSEMHDLCQECLDDSTANAQQARSESCERCKAAATDLRMHCDWEDGSCGRIYQVCGACVSRE
jgi:hypothetical protein